jgi:peroxiredoxin
MHKKILKRNFVLTFFYIAYILICQSHLTGDLEFGDSVKMISLENIHGDLVAIPNKGKVTVLFLFDSTNKEHLKIVSELNFMFFNLINQKLEVSLNFVTRGDQESLLKLHRKHKLKFNLFNDQDDYLFPLYQYTCGVCVRLVILDKKGIVRYYIARIDKYFIIGIIQRYASSMDE